MTELQTGGDAVCVALERLGVRCVFGVPSQQNLGLYDALARRNSIRVVGARHEAGAVHEADGYARATGELGVAIVSTGPGTANAVNGLYEAGFASSPVLLITTQVDRIHLGRGRGFIHDADGQFAMLQSVTRRTERVLHAHKIAETIVAVADDICTGRPQPGAVEIPTDLLTVSLEVVPPIVEAITSIVPDETALIRAAEFLGAAKRPLIWVGGGSVGAADEIRALVERLGAPVVSSINGRGVVPTDHPLFIGSTTHFPAFSELLENADAVLAIGTRFQAVATWFWSLPMPARLCHIDVDPAVFGRNYPAEIPIVSDAKLAVAWLNKHVSRCAIDADFQALAARVRTKMAQDMDRRIGPDHMRICDVIDRVMPKDRNVVCDATMTGNSWGNHRLQVRRPYAHTYITSLAIGPALPIGIGQAIGSGRRTIVIHGDGGVMLNIGELATAVQEKAPVIVLVFNNRGYGVLKLLQEQIGARRFGVDLHTPDFVALGAAMGMPSHRVDSVETFEEALCGAIVADSPTLIEIDLTKMAPVGL